MSFYQIDFCLNRQAQKTWMMRIEVLISLKNILKLLVLTVSYLAEAIFSPEITFIAIANTLWHQLPLN